MEVEGGEVRDTRELVEGVRRLGLIRECLITSLQNSGDGDAAVLFYAFDVPTLAGEDPRGAASRDPATPARRVDRESAGHDSVF
jgi:hypothetical protein